MTEEILRHRFVEAGMLVRGAEAILREVRKVAGNANGAATAADARINELMTIATKIEEHIKDLRPVVNVEIRERGSPELAEAVKEARSGGQEADEE